MRRNGISIIYGTNINVIGNEIHDIIGTNPQSGIDIEKDQSYQNYENILISNNRIYNTVKESIFITGKISDLTISENEMSKSISTRVKPRKKIDPEDSDEFPTNASDDYIMEKYNIVISNNSVIDANTITSEHGNYEINAIAECDTITSEQEGRCINTLNYRAYIRANQIIEKNKVYVYNLKVKDKYTIATTFKPSSPTYMDLSYESSNPSVATVSAKGVITAVSSGTTEITVKSIDYGAEPYSSDDDRELSYKITINVTE